MHKPFYIISVSIWTSFPQLVIVTDTTRIRSNITGPRTISSVPGRLPVLAPRFNALRWPHSTFDYNHGSRSRRLRLAPPHSRSHISISVRDEPLIYTAIRQQQQQQQRLMRNSLLQHPKSLSATCKSLLWHRVRIRKNYDYVSAVEFPRTDFAGLDVHIPGLFLDGRSTPLLPASLVFLFTWRYGRFPMRSQSESDDPLGSWELNARKSDGWSWKLSFHGA